MKKVIEITYIILLSFSVDAQTLLTPFEKSGGKQTSTYFECVRFYETLDQKFANISIKKLGLTDAGYPLHLVLFSSDGQFNIEKWHQKKAVIFISNGIHPGEPDGVDASMMLMRDLASGKLKAPKNIAIALIALYNIGGALNRNSVSRVNQNGPESYGFRGNAQNLDLNRDFTKNDSYNARTFATIFHQIEPTIFIDNHVSDGADYQHTMTLLSTQHDKLGGQVGEFLKKVFEPQVYKSMLLKNDAICPYVDFEDGDPQKGWASFYDPPRYSTGYAALFQTIGFMPETHMLKPFVLRVQSTYNLMVSMIEVTAANATNLIAAKKAAEEALLHQNDFALNWIVDSSRLDTIRFKGYTAGLKTSEVTGMPRLFYDHKKPFEKDVVYYDNYKGGRFVTAPEAYIIPQGWHDVLDALKHNKVSMRKLSGDTSIEVEVCRIEDYKSYTKPYEKHHKNYDVVTGKKKETLRFLKGDFVVTCHQPARRYLVEMLEPSGDDSFFAWNFFDAILQQKEGYSDYRWEDVAAEYLQQHPEVRQQLNEKKTSDTAFAASSSAQLNFVYKHSPYYESAHLRYPVYRYVR